MILHADSLKLGTQRKHELQRERWTTAAHLKIFYDNLKDLLLKLGIAELNPDYDANKLWRKGMTEQEQHDASLILIVRPDSLCSMDETEATTNMSGGSQMGRTASERILRANDEWDKGETLAGKTSH